MCYADAPENLLSALEFCSDFPSAKGDITVGATFYKTFVNFVKRRENFCGLHRYVVRLIQGRKMVAFIPKFLDGAIRRTIETTYEKAVQRLIRLLKLYVSCRHAFVFLGGENKTLRSRVEHSEHTKKTPC